MLEASKSRIYYMVDLKALQEQIAKFDREIATEVRLVRVGLKDKSETVKVYKKYKELFTLKNLKGIKESLDGFSGDDKEIAERIYFYIAGGFIEQKLAGRYDQLTTFYSGSKVKFEGENLSFYETNPRISKDPIYARRELLDNSALKVVSKAKIQELGLLKAEINGLKTIGWKGYLDYASVSKKMDYEKFESVVLKITKGTDGLWEKTMSGVCRESFGRPFKKIRSCHLLYLRSLSTYDNYFPQDKVVPTFERFARVLGLGGLLKSIKIDAVDRPKKNPRAVCFLVNPPQDIHLVIKPIGGEQDFEAMFHEGGHSLNGASFDPTLPYVFRNISRSHALTEAYAFLLEDLVFEPAWLSRYLNVSAHTGNKIKWQATFVNLMLLRRYLGKFLYEYEIFSKDKLATAAAVYAKRLEETTGFVHQREKYLFDMDGHFYSADYLRAWIGAAQIKDCLKRKFGIEWFFNPKAGTFLRELWGEGVKLELEDVVMRLGYKPWDISLLVSGYLNVLK